MLKLKQMNREEALKEYKEMVKNGNIEDNPINWHRYKRENVSIQSRLEYFGYSFSKEKNKLGYKDVLTPLKEVIGCLNIPQILELIELEELRNDPQWKIIQSKIK